MIDVISEIKGVGVCFQAGDYSAGLQRLHSIWDKIPEPKVETPNAYMVIEYGAALSLRTKDFDEARIWASRAPLFIEKRNDSGEVEYLIGKVAFECGETETAKQNFVIANKKSKGRIFQGEDAKYRALIQK